MRRYIAALLTGLLSTTALAGPLWDWSPIIWDLIDTAVTVPTCVNLRTMVGALSCGSTNPQLYQMVPYTGRLTTLRLQIPPVSPPAATTSCDVTFEHGTPGTTTAADVSAKFHYGGAALNTAGESVVQTITWNVSEGDWLRIALAADAEVDCAAGVGCVCLTFVAFAEVTGGPA